MRAALTVVVVATFVMATVVLMASLWTSAAPGEQAVKISAGTAKNEFAFEPGSVTVTAGSPVQLTVVNTGKISHDFVVEQLRITLKEIDPGKSVSHRFTPTKKGTFEYICSIPGHKEAGMKGMLIVK